MGNLKKIRIFPHKYESFPQPSDTCLLNTLAQLGNSSYPNKQAGRSVSAAAPAPRHPHTPGSRTKAPGTKAPCRPPGPSVSLLLTPRHRAMLQFAGAGPGALGALGCRRCHAALAHWSHRAISPKSEGRRPPHTIIVKAEIQGVIPTTHPSLVAGFTPSRLRNPWGRSCRGLSASAPQEQKQQSHRGTEAPRSAAGEPVRLI